MPASRERAMSDSSHVLTLVLVVAVLAALVIAIRVVGARRSPSERRRGAGVAALMVAVCLAVVFVVATTLQRRELAAMEIERERAKADALRRRSETVGFALAVVKVLKARHIYGPVLEPVLERDKALAHKILSTGYPFDSARVLWVQDWANSPTT